jgi:hypothetical protein
MQIFCPHCGKPNIISDYAGGQHIRCPGCGGIMQAPASQSGPTQFSANPYQAAPQYGPAGYAGYPTPGKATAVSILVTVGGGFATLTALGVLAGTCGLWVFAFYSLVAGIMALVYGIQSFSTPRGMSGRLKTAAIMLIITVISFDILSMTLGIVALVMISDPESQNYFA